MTAIEYYSGKAFSAGDYFDWDRQVNNSGPVPNFIIQNSKNNPMMKGMFQSGVLVDLGCGPGTSFPLLLERFPFKKCIAIDASSAMLSFIEDRRESFGIEVELQQKNLHTDKLDIESKSVDLAICCNTIKYLHPIQHLFSEVSRILKQKGFWGFDITTFKDFEEDYFMNDDDNSPSRFCYSAFFIKKLLSSFSLSLVTSHVVDRDTDTDRGVDLARKLFIVQKN